MPMVFAPKWLQWDVNKTKIEKLQSLGVRSKNQQKNLNYLLNNRAKRQESEAFLACFNETDMRSAVQRAVAKFKHDPEVNKLLLDAIGTGVTITIDQGTHQAEDVATGGFMLHFDARRPDGKCFHLYVGQETNGLLKIISASYKAATGNFAHVPAT
jgi:hypothetical protein